MSKNIDSVMSALERVATDVVAAHAADVDRNGRFPRESIDALAASGVLGWINASEVGGAGLGVRAAALAVERIARECASTAMVLCMHYAGASILEKLGPLSTRKEIAAGKHLSSLAFSEVGSRSHFWAPQSTARIDGEIVTLDARKSWITSASQATAYVWSSRPAVAEGAATIWLVPRTSKGLQIGAPFDGLGLRGNDSSPVTADGVTLPTAAMLGADGAGIDVMMGIVLPIFNVMNGACSVGLMESAVAKTANHAVTTKFEHLGSTMADMPVVRASIARMRIRADMARSLWLDTIDALESGRTDAQLRVLECKAACADTAIEVLDLAMRVGGGAAFRKEVGLERLFRDARAAAVMAPTSDALHDFIGKAVCGLPVL